MNKKLLFGIMSLAALTACTNDEFESQNVAQEESPIQFEVLNNNDGFTRASMDGNKIKWSAEDGDKFTLYHGCALPNAGQNAIYTATAEDGKAATLTTPSMILAGNAIMVWPADTAFTIPSGDALSITVPAKQTNIEKHLPYVSDVINIGAYKAEAPYNTAGLNRAYPIYMRPMASQLIINADYAGTDETLATLEAGEDGITPIEVTSIDLESGEPFTTKIALAFKGTKNAANWKQVKNNAFDQVTEFGAASATSGKLTTTVLDGNASCKFLLLPQTAITNAANKKVVVNTIYGKVEVSPAVYTKPAEYNDSWYRFISEKTAPAAGETKAAKAETAGENKGKFKTTAKIEDGLLQTISGFTTYTHQGDDPVKGEPEGAAATRYVKVLLNHLDMSDLHIKGDKQLRDAAKVWQKMGLGSVTVILDGDKKTGEIEISQKTIKAINDINAAAAKEKTPREFTVKGCVDAGEVCKTIVITGASEIQNIQDLTFIVTNGGTNPDVALKAGETWKWNGTTDKVKQIKVGTGVARIINKGTMENAATATLAIFDATATQIYTVPFKNEGTWNITGGDLNVQFDVTNIGTVNISKGAEYHQDGAGNDFTNDAETLPQRFLAKGNEKIGLVNNSGVFACVKGGNINNYGLVEHLDDNAKTYITTNNDGGTGFNVAFAADNRIGRINLPFSNKDEENVSISNGAATGFVSVTVSTTAGAPSDGKLDLSKVGDYVNYCIIKGGVTEISKVAAKIQYVEFDAGTDEIMWSVAAATYEGLIVFSPVNVKRGTTITVNQSAFLKAKMYVGGSTTLNKAKCDGYFGDTQANFDTMYLTY